MLVGCTLIARIQWQFVSVFAISGSQFNEILWRRGAVTPRRNDKLRMLTQYPRATSMSRRSALVERQTNSSLFYSPIYMFTIGEDFVWRGHCAFIWLSVVGQWFFTTASTSTQNSSMRCSEAVKVLRVIKPNPRPMWSCRCCGWCLWINYD